MDLLKVSRKYKLRKNKFYFAYKAFVVVVLYDLFGYISDAYTDVYTGLCTLTFTWLAVFTPNL